MPAAFWAGMGVTSISGFDSIHHRFYAGFSEWNNRDTKLPISGVIRTQACTLPMPAQNAAGMAPDLDGFGHITASSLPAETA